MDTVHHGDPASPQLSKLPDPGSRESGEPWEPSQVRRTLAPRQPEKPSDFRVRVGQPALAGFPLGRDADPDGHVRGQETVAHPEGEKGAESGKVPVVDGLGRPAGGDKRILPPNHIVGRDPPGVVVFQVLPQ